MLHQSISASSICNVFAQFKTQFSIHNIYEKSGDIPLPTRNRLHFYRPATLFQITTTQPLHLHNRKPLRDRTFPRFLKKEKKNHAHVYTRTSSNFSRGIRAPRDLIAAAGGDRLEIAISLSTSIVHARARLELVLLLLETGFIGGFSLRGEYT